MGPFDYICDDSVTTGDLVHIPFKGQSLPGVVWSLSSDSEIEKLQSVERIIQKSFFSEGDIRRFNALAQITAQSPSQYLQLMTTISAKESFIRPISLSYRSADLDSAKDISDSSCISAPAKHWPLLLSSQLQSKGQNLIIVPNADIGRFITGALPKKFGAKYCHDVRSRTLQQSWRQGPLKTLVTMRHGAILPASNLSSVFIIDDANPDYDFRPRNPRFDGRFAAHLQSEQHNCPLIRIGHSYDLSTHLPQTSIHFNSPPPIHFIDPAKHPSSHAYLSHPISQAIEERLEKSGTILLYLNKKGVATHFQCRGCGHLPTCGNCGAIPVIRKDDLICSSCSAEMWHPESCPSCHKKLLTKKGIGVDHVISSLHELHPEAIITSTIPKNSEPWPDILIVSEAEMRSLEFNPFASFSCIVDLSADYHFLDTTYRADAYGRYKLLRSVHLAQSHHADCYIQAYQIKRIQMILSDDWIDSELALRKEHQLPPHSVQFTHIPHESKTPQIHRFIDKIDILRYFEDFKSVDHRDILDVDSQIEAYERITPSK